MHREISKHKGEWKSGAMPSQRASDVIIPMGQSLIML